MTTEEIKAIAEAVAAALVEPISDRMLICQKDVLNMEEASRYTGISINMLYKMTHRRRIPYSRPTGRHCFFKRADLETSGCWRGG